MLFHALRMLLYLGPNAPFLLRCWFSRVPTTMTPISHCLRKGFCSLGSSAAPSLLAGSVSLARHSHACPCVIQPDFCSGARSDPNFRNGLLQGFGAANKHAKTQSCLVRKFAVLVAPLSVQNGELNPDGSVSCFTFRSCIYFDCNACHRLTVPA